jgi:hypothetical protein
MDEITRGKDAARILNEPLYQEAFSLVKDGIVKAMTQSAMGDEKTHNRQVIALQVLEQLRRHLQTAMETGQMAELQLQDKKGIIKRFIG